MAFNSNSYQSNGLNRRVVHATRIRGAFPPPARVNGPADFFAETIAGSAQASSLNEDEDQAFHLQLQEALYASVWTSMSSSVSSSALPISSSTDSSSSLSMSVSSDGIHTESKNPKHGELCIICLEVIPSSSNPVLSCGHHTCESCLISYLEVKIKDKNVPIACVQPGCTQTLTLESCSAILPSPLHEAWVILLAEQHVPHEHRVYCPFPDCSSLLIKDIVDEEEASAECPSCNRLFCMRCVVPWHAEMSCSEYQKLPVNERSREDQLLRNLAKEMKWSRCSNCKHLIELRQGCNHMTCRCGNEFCYLCGAKWTSNSHICKVRRTR